MRSYQLAAVLALSVAALALETRSASAQVYVRSGSTVVVVGGGYNTNYVPNYAYGYRPAYAYGGPVYATPVYATPVYSYPTYAYRPYATSVGVYSSPYYGTGVAVRSAGVAYSYNSGRAYYGGRRYYR